MPPSVTTWSRLEPVAREQSMEHALRAEVRDPLWMLARQWQVGEFLGDDAGSPVCATVQCETVPLTSYRPGAAAGAPLAFAPDLPLEARMEREPVTLGLRGSVRLGTLFERWLAEAGAGAHVGAFRTEYEIAAAGPAGLPDPDADRVRLLAAGRVTDGEALAQAALAAADPADVAPIPALPDGRDEAAAVVARLRDHRRSLFSEPAGDRAWAPDRLEHEFAVGAESSAGAVGLHARDVRAATLDWHAFNVGDALAAAGGAEPTVRRQTLIPNLVSFRGMPNDRWWEFEEGTIDFGRLDVAHVDLAKLLVMEFALVYGNDWFELPVRLPASSLSRVTHLVVTDTFGERTVVRPTASSDGPKTTPWRMFALTGDRADHLLLAPTLRDSLDGPELDRVVMLRDDMAALGWAVEERVRSQLDRPLDAHEAYFARVRELPAPLPEPVFRDEPDIDYRVGTEVPDNWIPLVPVQNGPRSFVFRRGVMGGALGRPAVSPLLEPGGPYYIAEEAIPRAGVRVTRRFRRARGPDGSTHVWLAREAAAGRGPGASGLAFDVLVPRAGDAVTA